MGEWCDRDAETALASHYGCVKVERSIVDGQKGYTVTRPNGVRCFHFRLESAFADVAKALGHGEDRDVMVIGEPEEGNAWQVRRTENPLTPPENGGKKG